ncbi:MAG: SDR family oxidoreductase [Steroidobacteraceae bacterium]
MGFSLSGTSMSLDCFVPLLKAGVGAMADRTAIVTGAGKRVGAAIARALLEDGWVVAAHVRHQTDEVPAGANRIAADLSDAGSAEAIFKGVSDLPPVRLLVNNAARFTFDGLGRVSAAEFDRHLAVNARAPLMLIEALAARHEHGDASVVNILDAKLAAPNPDFLSYTVSKQALAALTELTARALAPRGIRVNGIAPALMLRSNGQSDANFGKMHANNPLRRGITPDDVIGASRYLVGAKAVTGQVITIDSGQRFMALARDVQFLEGE